MNLTAKNLLRFLLFVALVSSGLSALEEISDDELKKLIAQEHYVVVLFSEIFPLLDSAIGLKLRELNDVKNVTSPPDALS